MINCKNFLLDKTKSEVRNLIDTVIPNDLEIRDINEPITIELYGTKVNIPLCHLVTILGVKNGYSVAYRFPMLTKYLCDTNTIEPSKTFYKDNLLVQYKYLVGTKTINLQGLESDIEIGVISKKYIKERSLMENSTRLTNMILNEYDGLNVFLENKGIKYKDIDKQVMQDYVNTKNISTVREMNGLTDRLNMLFKILEIDIEFQKSDFFRQRVLKEKKYYSRNEFLNLIESIDEYVGLILYGLFLGIHKNRCEAIRNLKFKDIDFENKRIKTIEDNNPVEYDVDDYFLDLCVRCNKIEGRFSTGERIMYYNYNMQSEYVLKTVPMSTNNMGMNRILWNFFFKEIKDLNEVIKKDKRINIKTVRTSGAIYRMKLLHENEGIDWNLEETRKFAEKEDLPPLKLRSAYFDTYGNNY